jgi:hypothetical protein
MTKPIGRDAIYRCRRFSAETIELCVRWYITYRLSYRDLAAMMAERDVIVTHTTIMRWVLRYAPEYECRWARFSRPPGESWRMDETAVSVRGGRTILSLIISVFVSPMTITYSPSRMTQWMRLTRQPPDLVHQWRWVDAPDDRSVLGCLCAKAHEQSFSSRSPAPRRPKLLQMPVAAFDRSSLSGFPHFPGVAHALPAGRTWLRQGLSEGREV